MANGQNTKRVADGDTAETQNKRKKPKWPCRATGCVKQAQSGRKSYCKRCYKVFLLNHPTINLTQGDQHIASLGNRVSNNATVSLQREATSIYRAEKLASFNDRVNNGGTRAGINKNISHDNPICDNYPMGSLQSDLTLIDRFGAENNTSVFNKRGTSVEQYQRDKVADNNTVLHDADHTVQVCSPLNVANVYPSTSSLSQSKMGPQLEPAVDKHDEFK